MAIAKAGGDDDSNKAIESEADTNKTEEDSNLFDDEFSPVASNLQDIREDDSTPSIQPLAGIGGGKVCVGVSMGF